MTRLTLLVLLLAGCTQCPVEARQQREAARYVPPDKSVNVQPPMR